jgi:phosphoglucosamine mutase
VTALEVLRVVIASGCTIGELAADIPLFPQEQVAVRVRHREQWEGDPAIRAAIRDAEARLGPMGRVLVRPSGTEPALRVMVEGEDAPLVAELATAIASVAKERLD